MKRTRNKTKLFSIFLKKFQLNYPETLKLGCVGFYLFIFFNIY